MPWYDPALAILSPPLFAAKKLSDLIPVIRTPGAPGGTPVDTTAGFQGGTEGFVMPTSTTNPFPPVIINFPGAQQPAATPDLSGGQGTPGIDFTTIAILGLVAIGIVAAVVLTR